MLKAIGLAKSSWYYEKRKKSYEEKYEYLRSPLMEIAREHPAYGYRRTVPELRMRGYVVNHKVVRRLHKIWHLTALKGIKLPKPSVVNEIIQTAKSSLNLVAKLEEIDIFEVLYTDFTEIIYAHGRKKAHFMPILDHKSKYIPGFALGSSCNTLLAHRAWKNAVEALESFGIDLRDVIIHHDRDAVYRSYAWLRDVLIRAEARVSYSEKGAKENVYMESFNGRFKKENRDLFYEQENLFSLKEVIAQKIAYHNFIRLHSTIGYQSPIKYLNNRGFSFENTFTQ